jgi:hypothetical protein
MEFAKLLAPENSDYVCIEASNIEMGILGNLLSRDVECNIYPYKETLADDRSTGRGGNFTSVEKEGDYVFIIDLYSEEVVPTEFKILKKVFIQLLDDWQEKVCKHKPREVIIKYKNDQFIIETSH